MLFCEVVALGDADAEQTVEDDGSHRLSFDQAAPGVLEDLGAFGDHSVLTPDGPGTVSTLVYF